MNTNSEELEMPDGATVSITIFAATEAAALAAGDSYLSRWHPGGYGTVLRGPMLDESGTAALPWKLTGYRYRSC